MVLQFGHEVWILIVLLVESIIPQNADATKVQCLENKMAVIILKKDHTGLDPTQFHLNDKKCLSNVTKHLIIMETTLDGCGTTVVETENTIAYVNRVVGFNVSDPPPGAVTTRFKIANIPFNCTYKKSAVSVLLSNFEPISKRDAKERRLEIGSFGNFTFRMNLYKDKGYSSQYQPNDYPISVRVNDPIYVQYEVLSDRADLYVFAKKCLATTTTRETSKPRYVFIDKGCALDQTLTYNYAVDRKQRFKINAFRFIYENSVAYLHCMLIVCHSGANSSQCVTGCHSNERTRRSITREGRLKESNVYHLASGPLVHNDIDDGIPGISDRQMTIITAIGSLTVVLLVITIVLAVCLVIKRKNHSLLNHDHDISGSSLG